MVYSPEFEIAWKLYPPRSPDNPKKPAYKAWSARLREGLPPSLLTACIRNYAASVRQRGKAGTEFVMQAATFLGPNERWKAYEPKPEPETPRIVPKRDCGAIAELPVDRVAAQAFIRGLIDNLAKGKTSWRNAGVR